MKVYSREERLTKGLNDDELREAMSLYTDKVREEVINSLEEEYGIKIDMDEDGETLSYFHHAIDLAMTKGMELADNTNLLLWNYEQQKRISVNQITDYKFEIDKGVSGVLFSDGIFKKCGNAQHHFLMENVPHETQFSCLYFSSSLRSDGDGLITHSPVGFNGVTEDQSEWMKDNFKYFDRGQKRTSWLNWDIED
jgi:hypothetical protein